MKEPCITHALLAPAGEASEEEDPDVDLQNDHLGTLRKQAGLPEMPEDGLPSASSQKMMCLACTQNSSKPNCT